jgi:hypothetical protein
LAARQRAIFEAMEIRRPLAAVLTALALLGGGGATLTACGDPAGLDRNDGTSDQGSKNTDGNDPSGKSQGSLPDNSDPSGNDSGRDEQDSTGNGDNAGNG